MLSVIAVVMFFTVILPLTASSYSVYTVKKGDTIYAISRKTGASVSEILRLNNIKDAKKLYVGRKLKIPKSQATSSSGSNTRFMWPVSRVRHVASDGRDGVKSIGIIITVSPGAYIKSSAAGTVSKIGYVRGFGNYIVLNHGNRYMTVYSGLDYIRVREKQKVNGGNVIGKLSSSKNKFHFQINHAGKPLNALTYLPKKR